MKTEFKFGQTDVAGTTESIVWDGGGVYIFLTSAQTIDIVSDDANDTLLGTGARTLQIFGLDSDYVEINEIVELNGLTPVTTTLEFFRVFRMVVLTSGTVSLTAGANVGTIIATGGATKVAQINPLNGQTLMAIYTIPAGKTAHIVNTVLSVGKGREAIINGWIRNGSLPDGSFSIKNSVSLYEQGIRVDWLFSLPVPEKTDIAIGARTDVGATRITASFEMVLIDN